MPRMLWYQRIDGLWNTDCRCGSSICGFLEDERDAAESAHLQHAEAERTKDNRRPCGPAPINDETLLIDFTNRLKLEGFTTRYNPSAHGFEPIMLVDDEKGASILHLRCQDGVCVTDLITPDGPLLTVTGSAPLTYTFIVSMKKPDFWQTWDRKLTLA